MTVTAGGAAATVMLTSRRSARVMIGAHLVVAVSYFVGAGGLLIAAAVKTGGLAFEPFGAAANGPDPMTLMPDLGGVELLLYLPVFLITTLWLPIGAIAVFGGVTLLTSRAAWHEHARLMWTLAGSTAAVLAYLLISVTQFGASIQQWLLS